MILTKVFNLKPPAYGVVSATYLVEPKESKGIDMIVAHEERIQWWQRALEQNPEYLFMRFTSWQKELLVSCIQPHQMLQRRIPSETGPREGPVGGSFLQDPAQRPQASEQIKKVNFALFDGMTEVLKMLEQGLLDASVVKGTKDVLGYREYPFFCYPPEVFTDLKAKIRQCRQPGGRKSQRWPSRKWSPTNKS